MSLAYVMSKILCEQIGLGYSVQSRKIELCEIFAKVIFGEVLMDNKISHMSNLYDYYLDDDERILIDKIAKMITENTDKYYPVELWTYDAKIGGIGAYSIPADPVKNPFKGGYTRQVFRPLQYARCNIDILDIRYTTRYIVQNMGLHLEFVLKHILKLNTTRPGLFYNKKTLGYLVKKSYSMKLVDAELYMQMETLLAMYNHSKHEVNMDEERESSFTVCDTLCFYIITRKIATKILNPCYDQIYNELRRIGIIERFSINYERIDDFDFVV